MYYAYAKSTDPGSTVGFDIWRSSRESPDASWAPGAAAGLDAGDLVYEVPSFFQNGELWFTGQRSSLEPPSLYRAPISGAAFGTVTHVDELGAGVGKAILASDGSRVFYGKEGDIWTAERGNDGRFFGQKRVDDGKATKVNSGAGDAPAWISNDGCRLYFHSNRNGSYDLFVTTRAR